MLPPWISSENQYITRLVFKALNMTAAAEREIGGITASADGFAFDQNSIARLVKRSLFGGTRNNRPSQIGVFVDPNAGGPNHMAIVSMCMHNGSIIVCFFFFIARLLSFSPETHMLFYT
jgi:hypothetical protein